MDIDTLKNLTVKSLQALKARDIRVIDVRGKTTITDFMVIASGTSNRHVKALAENVTEKAKKAGVRPLGVEGEQDGEWVLVDLGDGVVHVMQPDIREFYDLEKLWSVEAVSNEKYVGNR
jgi:ribosome-associated protein